MGIVRHSESIQGTLLSELAIPAEGKAWSGTEEWWSCQTWLVHADHPSTEEIEAGGVESSRPTGQHSKLMGGMRPCVQNANKPAMQ